MSGPTLLPGAALAGRAQAPLVAQPVTALDDLDRSAAFAALDHLERSERHGTRPLDLRGPRNDLAAVLDRTAEAPWANEALVVADRLPTWRATPNDVLGLGAAGDQ